MKEALAHWGLLRQKKERKKGRSAWISECIGCMNIHEMNNIK
jgi:hypothetical protein